MAGEDTELVRKACLGDARAFRDLLNLHYATIYRMAFKICGTKHDAEDVTQMACMKLAQNIKNFRGDSAFTTWMYTIVLNTVRDHHRAQARHTATDIADMEISDGDNNAEDALSTRQQMDFVRSLPEPERAIIFLVFGEGLSHRETARIMGCAESTISWRIHQARKILATQTGGRAYG